MFCLKNYDAYGFDLDHTLAKFNLVNLTKLVYDSIADILVDKRGYDAELKHDISDCKDFICKGLFVDADRGNIIKISHKGKILRGCHGSRLLSQEELVSIYGESLLWENFCLARNAVRSKAGDETFFFWENYFDIPALVACRNIVDQLDKQNGGPLSNYKSKIWPDIIQGLETMFRFQAFAENSGNFFPGLKKNPEKYYRPCSEGVKQWLKDLQEQNKVVFLTTSSHIDFASLTAEAVLGPEWRSYFNIVVTNARKPGFFKEKKPFLSLDGIKEIESVSWKDLEEHGVYSSGNHEDLEKFVAGHTGKENPKIVYFGDSLCSDAFPTKTMTSWDLVLVIEEMEAEGYHPHDNTHHYWEPDEKNRKIVRKVNLDVDQEEEAYILSSVWGSFFYHPEDDPEHNRHMNTFWGELVTKYCDIAIPSVEYIAGLPLEHQFPRFKHEEDGNTDGFSPAKPKPLMSLKLME